MSGRDEERGERGFTVVDRRGGDDRDEPRPSESAAGEEAAPPPRGGSEPSPRRESDLPPVDFSSFCISLGTSALYHLGVVPDPHGGQTASEPDLPLAQHTIDLLQMLQEKTRGNLEQEEAKLLEGLLYELRMRFVEVRKARSAPGGSED